MNPGSVMPNENRSWIGKRFAWTPPFISWTPSTFESAEVDALVLERPVLFGLDGRVQRRRVERQPVVARVHLSFEDEPVPEDVLVTEVQVPVVGDDGLVLAGLLLRRQVRDVALRAADVAGEAPVARPVLGDRIQPQEAADGVPDVVEVVERDGVEEAVRARAVHARRTSRTGCRRPRPPRAVPVLNCAPPTVTSPLTPVVPRPERVVRLMTPFAFSPYSAGMPPVMISIPSATPGSSEFENVMPIWSPIGCPSITTSCCEWPPWKWYRPFSSCEKPGVDVTIDSNARPGITAGDCRMRDLSMSMWVMAVSLSSSTASPSA